MKQDHFSLGFGSLGDQHKMPRRSVAAPGAELDWTAGPGWPRRRLQHGLPLLLDAEGQEPLATWPNPDAIRTKRRLDLAGAALLLLLLAPLLLFLAGLVRLTSPGPALFFQQRLGLGGRPFTIIKFRTMYHHRSDRSGVLQAVPGDDRVTPLGRVLRRCSLDELPQLINVLRGDMSLVGPRPHVPNMQAGGTDYDALVPYYGQRTLVLPGITGWAQANGLRGSTTDAACARARVDHDVAYVQNLSLLLDLRIVLLTVGEVLTGTGH